MQETTTPSGMMFNLGRPLRILLVDDDEDDYLILRDLVRELEEEKLELSWIPHYHDAVSALAGGTYDVYLVDYHLGEKTGVDFLAEASKRGNRAPMIVLTGAGDRSLDMEAMRRGAADFLVKPRLTSELLERSIRYSLKSAQDLERIREREANFRNLFDSASEGMIVHDFGAAILDANATAGKIFGCALPELIGRDFLSFFHPRSREEIAKCRDRHQDGEIHYEAIAQVRDGREIHIEAYSKVIRYHGRLVRLTSLRDVTVRKELEVQVRMQDRMASVGLLTSGLAHEIGNPLSVIQGRIYFLAKLVAGSEKAAENVRIIGVQIERISGLIRSFLSMARGTEKVALESVDLNQVVDDVLGLMTYEFRKRHIEVRNELMEEVGAGVKADAAAMQQVLLNLFLNAAHAMETERPAGHFLRISAARAEDRLELFIEDSGCGIPGQNLQNLFKPFFSTKGAGKGTGLGLATCHRIVQSWGGTIGVESEVGAGTTFRICLPRSGSSARAV